MDKIVVTLLESFSDLEEGFRFKVDEIEIFDENDLEQRMLDSSMFIIVEYFGEEYFVRQEILEEILERYVD